jgi:hypothetical protein
VIPLGWSIDKICKLACWHVSRKYHSPCDGRGSSKHHLPCDGRGSSKHHLPCDGRGKLVSMLVCSASSWRAVQQQEQQCSACWCAVHAVGMQCNFVCSASAGALAVEDVVWVKLAAGCCSAATVVQAGALLLRQQSIIRRAKAEEGSAQLAATQ